MLDQLAIYILEHNKYYYNNKTTAREISDILKVYIQLSIKWKESYQRVNPGESSKAPLTDKWIRNIYKVMKNQNETELAADIANGNVDMKLRNKIWADISLLMQYRSKNPAFFRYWKPYNYLDQMKKEGLVTIKRLPPKIGKPKPRPVVVIKKPFSIPPILLFLPIGLIVMMAMGKKKK